MTFLWSDGAASFEPYHLEGSALEAWYESARQARERLATAADDDDPSIDLALLGHKLYRGLFQLDAPTSAAETAHTWWQSLQAKDEATSLEIATDRPGCIPWNLVYEQPPDNDTARSGPKTLRYRHFWGFQHALGVGRRVHPLRAFPYLDKPSLLVAVDPKLESQLDSGLRRQLDDFAAAQNADVVRSSDELLERVRGQAPDVLLILSSVERGRLLLGDQGADLAELRQAFSAAEIGNPNPIVLLLGAGAPETTASWECFLGAAASELSSVIAPETPGSPATNVRAGLAWLTKFLGAQADVGEALREVRQDLGVAGLAFSAYCPPYVRVLTEGAEPDPNLPSPTLYELPAQPYRGLAAFDREDRALFSGREDDTTRIARLLDGAGACGLLLHGPACAGKASFLRAGMLPYLEDEALGYGVLRDRIDADASVSERDHPTLSIRPGADLAGQLAEALCAFCAQPMTYVTPTGQPVTVDLPGILRDQLVPPAGAVSEAIQEQAFKVGGATEIVADVPAVVPADVATAVDPVQLWELFIDDPDAFGRVLDAVTKPLPFELLIVVEQAEDLVTQVSSAAEKDHRQAAVAMLARLGTSRARCKVILSLRTEFFGRVKELFPSGKNRTAWCDAYLPPLSAKAMREALRAPSATESPLYATEAPRTKYAVVVAPETIERIVDDALALSAVQQTSAMALAQAACAFLVDRAKVRNETLIGLEHLRELRSDKRGPIDLILDKYVERRTDGLKVSRASKLSLKLLARHLYQRQTTGTVTRTLRLAQDLAPYWRGGDSIEGAVNAASDESVRLLEVQPLLVGGRPGSYVGLAHGALAAWGLRQEADLERRKFARTRVIDVLFVLVPLIFLAAAVSYFLTRLNLSGSTDEDERITKVRDQAALLFEKKGVEPLRLFEAYGIETQSAAVQLYHGALAQGDQALQAGNLLRARQHLLSVQPSTEVPFSETRIDRRGFEWHYLWRQANPERHTLLGHQGLVNAVAASPDSALAATAGHDGTVRLWNLKRQGEVAAIYRGHQGPVHAVAFAPDGKTLASAGEDGVVRLWDVKVGEKDPENVDQPAQQLLGHTGPVRALAFGKDAGTLVSGGADATAILWDAKTGKAKETIKGHKNTVDAVAFAPDGTRFVTGGGDRELIVWKADDGKKDLSMSIPGHVRGLAYSADGAMIAAAVDEISAGADIGMIRMLDAKTGKASGAPIPCGVGAFGVAFKPNSSIVVAAGKDHNLRAWDGTTGKEVMTWRGHFGWLRAVAVTPDGATVISSSHDNTVKAWNLTAASDMLNHGAWVQALAFSNDRRWLASGGSDGVVKIWDVSKGTLELEIKDQPGPVQALGFVPNLKEHKLAVGSWSDTGKGAVQLWEVTKALGKLHAKAGPTLEGHAKGVQCLAFSSKQTLATGGADGTVILWDSATGRSLAKLEGKAPVTSVAFSPSGGRVAAGDHAGKVRAWEVDTGNKINDIKVHHGPVHALAMLNEDSSFLTGGGDHLTMQWSWKANQSATLVSRAHHQPVTAIVMLGDRRFATGSWDRSVKFWDLQDAHAGEERFTLRGHSGAVRALAATANQEVLASGGNDGMIRLYRAK